MRVETLENEKNKLEREKIDIEHQYQKDIDKTKREHEIEIKTINSSWLTKNKLLEDKCAEMNTELAEIREKLRLAQNEISHSKIEKEQALQELEGKLRLEMTNEISLTAKGFEDKIKVIENIRDTQAKKIVELSEEIKNQERKNSTSLLKLEKEANALRQEISNLQKEQAIKYAEIEKLNKDISIATSTIEVFCLF